MAKQTPTACQALTLSHNMQIAAHHLLDDVARREPVINLPEYCRLGGDVSDETTSSGRSMRAARRSPPELLKKF
ncbi:MAG: hypothetical protein ACI8P0_001569 [Planctomycetaceae bacterium]|jgi:hypothetical protein